MRVLIDTNILISAALNPQGTPYKAFLKAVTYPNKGVICDQNIEELLRIFNRKFPAKMELLDRFLSCSLAVIEVVKTPQEETCSEEMVRDVKDRPILRAAISSNVSVLLTGDRDFLESGIEHPRMLSSAEFLELF